MSVSLTIVAVLAGVIGGVVGWLLPGDAVRQRRRVGPLVTVAAALLAAGIVGIVALVGMLVFGDLDFFGAAHLAYVGGCLSAPIVGLAVGARVITGRLPRWLALVSAGLLLPAPVGWYASYVAPYRLGVDEVTVSVDPSRGGSAPVRIGVLADLQTDDPGEYEREAVDRLLAAEPDLIVIPGDLFQGSAIELDRHEREMRQLLDRLEAPAGVYFVYGDTDGGGVADRLLSGTGIVTLHDETVDVTVGDRRIVLGGSDLDHWTESAAAMRAELAAAPDGTIRVLLAHRPDAVLDLSADSRIDLTVAGHTHGGQVVIPGFGPPVTMSDVPREVARGGLHEVRGNPIYVSTGVGVERGQAPRVRLFSRPTIGVIDLVDEP